MKRGNNIFYKNRYVIALYTLEGEFIVDVINNVAEMEDYIRREGIKDSGAHFLNQLLRKHCGEFPYIEYPTLKVAFFFIDVYERHNDIFKECDTEFIKYCENDYLRRLNKNYSAFLRKQNHRYKYVKNMEE